MMQNKNVSKILLSVGLSLCLFSLSACQTQGRNLQGPGQVSPQPGLTMTDQNMTDPNMANPNLTGHNMMDRNMQNAAPQTQGNNAGADNARDPMGMDNNGNNEAQQLLPMKGNEDAQKSRNIETQLNNMREVSESNCVINGDTAVVGFKPSDGAKDTTQVKNRIAEKVKQIYPNLKEVAVSEKADVMNEIRQLSKDIMNNGGENIGSRLSQLLRKVNPVVQ